MAQEAGGSDIAFNGKGNRMSNPDARSVADRHR
jgi:hypothetical protein